MNINITNITKENIRDCVRLKVAEDQKEFVAPNVNTIAWAYVDENFTPYAIYDWETIIGLTAVEDIPGNEDYDRYWIPRFMIGEEHQGKGYGKLAMEAIIQMVAENPNCQRIRLSVWPGNLGAIEFYKKIGFVETDEWLEDERVMDYFIH